eukprot:gene6546-22038_t
MAVTVPDDLFHNAAEYRDELQLTTVYQPAGHADARLGTVAFSEITVHIGTWKFTSVMRKGECFHGIDALSCLKELVVLEQVPHCLRRGLRKAKCSYTIERRCHQPTETGSTTALALWRVGFDSFMVRRVLAWCSEPPKFARHVRCKQPVRLLPVTLCRFPWNPWSPCGFLPPRVAVDVWP